MESETPAVALEREHREIDEAVAAFLREHAQIWTTLEALESALDSDAGAGAASASDPSGLCRELTTQLLHHNVKEERVLYPRADLDLNEAAVEKLRALLDSADLPGGWVCVKAR